MNRFRMINAQLFISKISSRFPLRISVKYFGFILFALLVVGTALLANEAIAFPLQQEAVQENDSPQTINYQGYLTDSDGKPVADEPLSMKFILYQDQAGEIPIGCEVHEKVQPIGGMFLVELGSGEVTGDCFNRNQGGLINALSVDVLYTQELFLGITVDDEAEMRPLQKLASTVRAVNADQLAGTDGNNLIRYDRGSRQIWAEMFVVNNAGVQYMARPDRENLINNNPRGDAVIRSITGSINLNTNNTDSMWIGYNGSVGIGTRKPLGKLHINYTPITQSGLITVTANTNIVEGTGTQFEEELSVGSELLIANEGVRKIVQIDDDTHLTVDANWSNTITNTSYSQSGPLLRLHADSVDPYIQYSNNFEQHYSLGIDSGESNNFVLSASENLDSDQLMTITSDGNVGIGTTSPQAKLDVAGDVRVNDQNLTVPDYVFEEAYALMPLSELQEYIADTNHLPNIPNVEEIEQNGLNLGEFQMQLLEKVEELTLYTLAQQDEIEELRRQNAALEERLVKLENQLADPE